MRIIEDIRLILCSLVLSLAETLGAGAGWQCYLPPLARVGRDPAFSIVFSSIWFAWKGGNLDIGFQFQILRLSVEAMILILGAMDILSTPRKDRWTMMVCYLYTKTPSIYSIPIARLVDILCVCIYLLCIPWLWASNSWQLTIQYIYDTIVFTDRIHFLLELNFTKQRKLKI
jgi:hypothetical protein